MILIILLTKVILPRKDVLDFVLVDIWGLYCWDSKLGKLKHLWEKLYALLWPYTNTGCIIHCTVNTCSFMSEWSGLMIIPTAASEYVSGTMNMQRDFPAPVGIWTKVPFPWRARSIDSSWPGRKFIKPNTLRRVWCSLLKATQHEPLSTTDSKPVLSGHILLRTNTSGSHNYLRTATQLLRQIWTYNHRYYTKQAHNLFCLCL